MYVTEISSGSSSCVFSFLTSTEQHIDFVRPVHEGEDIQMYNIADGDLLNNST
jgi:hypothetical protein